MKKLKKAYPLFLLLIFVIFTGLYINESIQKTDVEIKGYFQIYFTALIIIVAMMSLIWLLSIYLKNVSIVDPFWGFVFVITGIYYFPFSIHGRNNQLEN